MLYANGLWKIHTHTHIQIQTYSHTHTHTTHTYTNTHTHKIAKMIFVWLHGIEMEITQSLSFGKMVQF